MNKAFNYKLSLIVLLGVFCGLSVILISKFLTIELLALIITIIPVLFFFFLSFFKNAGYINISNPLLLYSSFYFVFFGLGAFLYDGDYQSKILVGCMATIVGVIGYCGGYIFSNLTFKNSSFKLNNEDGILQFFKSLKFEKYLFIIGICGYLIYIVQIGQIPIFMNDLEQARVDASNAGAAIFRIFAMFLILSATIGFLNLSMYKNLKVKRPTSSLVRYVLSILLLFTLGNRSPIFNILFTSFLIFLFINYKGKVQVKKIIPIAIIALIVVVGFVGGVGAYRVVNTETFYSYPEYRNYLYEKDYIGLSWFVFAHYLTIGFENLMRVFEVVPNAINFKYGLSYIEPILTILPGPQFTLDMQIKMALNQNYFGGGTVPSVLGEAFANFGYLGWLLVPFFSMLFLRIVYLIFINNKSNLFIIIMYSYLLNHFSNSLLSGLASSSIFPYITILVYLYYGIYIKKTKKWKVVKHDTKIVNNGFSS